MIAGLPPFEMIYDAALDEAAFAHLPFALAEIFGARSIVVHWHSPDQAGHGELVHNRYFSEEQFARLDSDFVGEDLWSNAVQATHRLNQPWLADRLVDPAAYEQGRLYNEWIRAMGDDSFHALGVAIGGSGMIGELGLHRGRTQPAFGEPDAARLAMLLSPLRRMLDIRARLAGERAHGADIAALLDGASDAMLILHADGRPIHLNAAAEALLTRGDTLFLRGGIVQERRPGTLALGTAIAAAGKGATPMGATIALHGTGGARYTGMLAPVMVGAHRRVILVARDSTVVTASRTEQAARQYGLSPAEAEVATLLALGQSPRTIAERRGVSVLTVRGQAKTVMSKLGVRRQAEIAAVFAAIPGLAPRAD